MSESEKINETIGRRLRLLREANGWSQRRMARVLGRSYNVVHTLENAKTTLDVDDLFLIAGQLDVSPLEILQDLLTVSDLRKLNRALQVERRALCLSREQVMERLDEITDQTHAIQEILDRCI
jgi:transcriptional regulator with XRE-family HTH domain